MNQTQRANNSIKNDSLATPYGKYSYEEGLIDQIYELETQRFTIQASSSKALISNSYFQDSDSDVKEDQRTSNDIMAYLKAEFHERALLENQERFYKRSGRVGSARKPIDKSKETYDERTTRIKAFMAIAEDEPFVGKADARSGQWVNITMKKTCSKVTFGQLLFEQVPGNIVKYLGGRGKRKKKISSKEVVFTKVDESSSMLAPEITSDSESECDSQEPLPPLPKLIGAELAGTSNSLISLADLTSNMAELTLNTFVSKKKKQTSDKVFPVYVIKKKTKNKSPTVLESCFDKNADSSIEQLLLTLMKEVKGLKKQIKIPSGTSPSNSQSRLPKE
ncbi:hypothetical protein Tco_0665836, partial [Tanacetum coccineum]